MCLSAFCRSINLGIDVVTYNEKIKLKFDAVSLFLSKNTSSVLFTVIVNL